VATCHGLINDDERCHADSDAMADPAWTQQRWHVLDCYRHWRLLQRFLSQAVFTPHICTNITQWGDLMRCATYTVTAVSVDMGQALMHAQIETRCTMAPRTHWPGHEPSFPCSLRTSPHSQQPTLSSACQRTPPLPHLASVIRVSLPVVSIPTASLAREETVGRRFPAPNPRAHSALYVYVAMDTIFLDEATSPGGSADV
jgi:hypothetical protein